MKQQDLLLTPSSATALLNWRCVYVANQHTILTDFTEPMEGLESPWGGAKMVFFYKSARTDASALPDNAMRLFDWAKKNLGRLSYPAPSDFIGSSFLNQILCEVVLDPVKLAQPVNEAGFEQEVEPLFGYPGQLHPVPWGGGKTFPQNYPDMKQKLADGQLDIIFASNPAEASAGIKASELPDTVRSFTSSGGTHGNTNFHRLPL